MNIKSYIAASAAAVVLAGPASAMSISGTLAGLEGVVENTPGSALLVEPVGLSGTPYDFQAGFIGSDDAGKFKFEFVNDSQNDMIVELSGFTILQDSISKFAGGVTTTFGAQAFSTDAGVLDQFSATTRLAAGAFIDLIIEYGDPMGATGLGGPVGPDLDFLIAATPVPLPAGAALMVTALGGMAAMRRRKSAAAA